MTEDDQIREYTRIVGHPPRNFPANHPDLWMWKYAGSAHEHAKLLDIFFSDEVEGEYPQQEALFDAEATR